MKYFKYLIILAVGALILAQQGCKGSETFEDLPIENPPSNPYDTLTYPNEAIPLIEIDSVSFLGLHTHIFSQRCNMPACHDGSFEPDFRTVQSAYDHLVYHPITKNYVDTPLQYRVMPGDKDESMIWHRINYHNPPNFEMMPSSGNQLGAAEIANIGTWIDDGAKDLFDNNPTMLSLQPSSLGLLAFLPNSGGTRIDNDRGGLYYYPFTAPANDDIEFWFAYFDPSPAGDTVYAPVLSFNKIQFSDHPFDFSNAAEVSMTQEMSPYMSTSVFSDLYVLPTPLVPYSHHFTINPTTLGFSAGQTIYMRTYVQDSDHSSPTEIPKGDASPTIIYYFSMYLQ